MWPQVLCFLARTFIVEIRFFFVQTKFAFSTYHGLVVGDASTYTRACLRGDHEAGTMTFFLPVKALLAFMGPIFFASDFTCLYVASRVPNFSVSEFTFCN